MSKNIRKLKRGYLFKDDLAVEIKTHTNLASRETDDYNEFVEKFKTKKALEYIRVSLDRLKKLEDTIEECREKLEAIETELGAGYYPDAELRNAYSLIRRLCGYAGNMSYGYDNADRTMRST